MKKGFTMIELIFVIVILGVLAAVAIPKLNATRDDAEQAKAMTNLATLMGDLTSYYTAQGTFAANIGSMTNVPLSVSTGTENKGEFKIKNATCLTFEVNNTTGDLTITSVAENDANPVCKHLIANTSTQNILSGSYTCQGTYSAPAEGLAQGASYTYKDTDSKDTKAGMATVCDTAAPKAKTAIAAGSAETQYGDGAVTVPTKMDAFSKTVTMNFQGGGVAF